MKTISYMWAKDCVSMVINSKMVEISKDSKHYQEICDIIKAGGTEEDVQKILDADLIKMQSAIQVTPDIEIKNGQIYFKGEVVAGSLSERMLKMLEEGFNIQPMANFLTNLMENPSNRAVSNLYEFLEVGKCPITDDGHFLVYKAVRADYKDIHSGIFDNSIGSHVSMSRRKVDENPDQTCSHGLHVCSFNYLPHFARSSYDQGRVVICKVNPRDVVAIPRDYNNTKMRVCAYTVVDEHKDYYAEHEDKDVLSSVSVYPSTGPAKFMVQSTSKNIEHYMDLSEVDPSYWDDDESFSTLSKAEERMTELLNDSSICAVRIYNTATDVEIDSIQNENFEGNNDFLAEDSNSGDDVVSYSFNVKCFDKQGSPSNPTFIEEEEGFHSLAEALTYALEQSDNYKRIVILDENGDLIREILTP